MEDPRETPKQQAVVINGSPWVHHEELTALLERDTLYKQDEEANVLRDFGAFSVELPEYENIHMWDDVTARLIPILRRRQGLISPELQRESVEKLTHFINGQPEGETRQKALRVYDQYNVIDPSTVTLRTQRITPLEFFARAWIFAQSCENREDAELAIFTALSDAVEPSDRSPVCFVGVMDHFLINLFLPRTKGVLDKTVKPVEDYVLEFFNDPRRIDFQFGYYREKSDGLERSAILANARNARQAQEQIRENAIRWWTNYARADVSRAAFIDKVNEHIQVFFDSLGLPED